MPPPATEGAHSILHIFAVLQRVWIIVLYRFHVVGDHTIWKCQYILCRKIIILNIGLDRDPTPSLL